MTDIKYTNHLCENTEFKFFEDIKEEVSLINYQNDVYKSLLNSLNKKQAIKWMDKELGDIELKYTNVFDETLFTYKPRYINMKDDSTIFIFDIHGVVDFNLSIANFNIPIDFKLNYFPIKVRLLVYKNNNDIETIMKLLSNYYICPFVTRVDEQFFTVKNKIELLKFSAPVNRLPYLDLIGDKLITEQINKILGLTDLGTMLKWRKINDFEQIHMKITDTVNKLVKIYQYTVITTVNNPDFIILY